MNMTNSWKKTEEVEIDLIDLLRRICMRWKQALACALVFAVLLGGYGYLKNRKSAGSDDKAEVEAESLTAEEQQAVIDAALLSAEIGQLEEYLENSIVMQVDPYHKDRVTLVYSIDDVKKKDLLKVTESYLNFLTRGGVIDTIMKGDKKMWSMDRIYMAELISAWTRADSAEPVIVLDGEAEDEAVQTLIYIEVTGRDTEMAERLAKDVRTALEDYAASVKRSSGRHTLSLLDSQKNVTIDNDLQTRQHDKRAALSTNRASLKAATDLFTGAQKALYENEAGVELGSEEEEELAEASGSGISIKYILAGFAGGIFLYCCVFACLYMFRDTVKNQEEFKTYYNFPFFGRVSMKEKGDSRHRDAGEREKAQLLNRVRLACQKQKVDKLCLASDFSLNRQEKECLKEVSAQLKDWGIDTVLSENISGNISMWDTLSEVGVVLMICKIGTTTHRMIDEEMTFYTENDIDVIGAAALENL